jgi:hypothetical protein
VNTKIQVGKTRLLLVEGKTDKEFFIQLGFYLNFTSDTPLHIMMYDGKDNLSDFLALVQAESEFMKVSHIGIVRDADFDGQAFQSVTTAIQSANSENPERPQYTIPKAPLIFEGQSPTVGIFLMPDLETEGMLESLILKALADDDIMGCVNSYFDCLQEMNIEAKSEPLPKAIMRVYMAALYQAKVRTFIEGKNVDIETSGDDRNKSYLSDIYKMSWWNWNHPAFEPIKTFLRQLAE